MTPAIIAARKAKFTHQVHEWAHEPASGAYGREAVEELGVPAERVFKTLVVRPEPEELTVAVVPVSSLLNMKKSSY